MEVGASLALFGGLNALRGKLRDGLRMLGYTPCVAIAPTPAAAWLLALARREQPVLRPSDLPAALASVPTRSLVLGLALGWGQGAAQGAATG